MKLIVLHNNERTLNKTIENSKRLGFEVYPVNDGPRHKTIIKGFNTATKFDDEWFAIIGGDQFLLDNAKEDIIKTTKKTPKNIWLLIGYGFDYLWQRKRMIAPTIYRTDYLKQILQIIQEINDKTLRPEGFMIKKMEQKGHAYIEDTKLEVANHDFEQFYKDIYQKGYFQAFKCKNNKKLKTLREIIDNIKNKDRDHLVFLQGIDDFIEKTQTDILSKFNIIEKGSL